MQKARLAIIAVLVMGAAMTLCSSAQAQMEMAWVARYNGAGNGAAGMAVDGAGNVYVTGSTHGSGGASDFVTVKYDTSGNELWAVKYNGPGDFNDNANAIAVDSASYVYVTGESTGPHAAGDYGAYDYATTKYDTDGNQLWVARYNGPANGWDYPVAMAVDAAGNVYVTGYQTAADATSGADYATIKYDSDGNELWVATYNGPANGSDHATAIAVDAMGHVYVTGSSTGSDGRRGYATIKYDSDGSELWVNRLSWSSAADPVAVAVDAVGNVYVTGTGFFFDQIEPRYLRGLYLTVKYDANGKELWNYTYNRSSNLYSPLDGASALALDTAGNVYVTGRIEDLDTAHDYATIKYDAFGSVVWVARYNGPANGSDSATAIALDAAGHVYVTGASAGPDGSLDIATVQYDTDGNEIGVFRYGGPAQGSDSPCAIAADSSGNIYVTGSIQGETSSDFLTIKLSPGNGANNGSGGGSGSGGCFIAASCQSPSGLGAGTLLGLVFCWIIRQGLSRHLRGALE
jgi:hypothetical protein